MVILHLIYIVFALSYVWPTYATDGQCDRFKQYCPNGTHTMCKYSGIGKNCNTSRSGGITYNDQKVIVDAHNHYRNFVASGNETQGHPGPQPSAANMMKLSWDEDLALVAQRWADQCNSTEDHCRNDPRGNVGQSIFQTMYGIRGASVNWRQVISNWYGEISTFPNSCVPSYRLNTHYRHYSQIVWGESYLVGCGKREFNVLSSAISTYYVCNYYPAGNIPDKPVYINGTPCSRCPNDTVCEYNLCVNQTIVYQNMGFFGKMGNYLGNLFRWILSLFGLQ